MASSKKSKKGIIGGIKVTLAVVVILALSLILVALVAQVTSTVTGKSFSPLTGFFVFGGGDNSYELTKSDVFANENFDGTKVSVFGIKLGDPGKKVKDILGNPDIQQVHPPNILNLEYGKSLEMEKTGLIIHLESDVVTQIVVKEPFNKYLKGNSRVVGEKPDIYRIHGKPDELDIVYPQTHYSYFSKNYIVIADAGDINGYVFMY